MSLLLFYFTVLQALGFFFPEFIGLSFLSGKNMAFIEVLENHTEFVLAFIVREININK